MFIALHVCCIHRPYTPMTSAAYDHSIVHAHEQILQSSAVLTEPLMEF